jgi:hypothetical protein
MSLVYVEEVKIQLDLMQVEYYVFVSNHTF